MTIKRDIRAENAARREVVERRSSTDRQHKDTIQIITALRGIISKMTAREKRSVQQGTQKAYREWIALMLVFWALVMTGLLARAAFDLVAATQGLAQKQNETLLGQQAIMKAQLAQMQAEQRPWIYPEVIINGPIDWSAANDARIRLLIALKNTGRTPAVGAVTAFEVHPLQEKAMKTSMPEQQALCEKARQQSSNARGKTLFPGETKYEAETANASAAEIARAWPDGRHVSFRIVGCIDYAYASDATIRGQTGFSYDLHQIGSDGHYSGFDPNDGQVQQGNMALNADFFHGWYLK